MIIIENLIVSVVNWIDFFVILLVTQYLCGAHLRLTNRNLLYSAAGSGVAITVLSFCVTANPWFTIIYVSLCIVTVLLLSDRRFIDCCLYVLGLFLYTVLCTIPDSLCQYLFPNIANATWNLGELSLSVSSICVSLVMMLLFLTVHFLLQKYHVTLRLSPRERILAFMVFAYSLLVMLAAKFVSESVTVPIYSTIWAVILVIAFIAGIAYFIYTITESTIRMYHETMLRTQTAYLTTQLEGLQTLKDKEADIHRMRHDLKKHLTVIEELYAAGHYDQVRDYTAQLKIDYTHGSEQPLSGNAIADIVLRSRMQQARERGIEFTYEGSMAGLSALSEPEICSLLSNAYDNALEACALQEHAYIRTHANTTKHYFYLAITNSVSHRVPIHGNHAATTKADRYNHGYGITIMQQIAVRHHGQCKISCTKEEFRVEIEMSLSQ